MSIARVLSSDKHKAAGLDLVDLRQRSICVRGEMCVGSVGELKSGLLTPSANAGKRSERVVAVREMYGKLAYSRKGCQPYIPGTCARIRTL